MALRALAVSCDGKILQGRGATIAIKMPVVISYADPVWGAVSTGNITMVQRDFSAGIVTPFVVDRFGESLLHVSLQLDLLMTSTVFCSFNETGQRSKC